MDLGGFQLICPASLLTQKKHEYALTDIYRHTHTNTHARIYIYLYTDTHLFFSCGPLHHPFRGPSWITGLRRKRKQHFAETDFYATSWLFDNVRKSYNRATEASHQWVEEAYSLDTWATLSSASTVVYRIEWEPLVQDWFFIKKR